MDVKPKVLKAKTAAALYDTDARALLKMRHDGKLQGKQIGKHIYFDAKELERVFAI